ncbi:glutathione S-transferase U9-like [Ziziphus jujuba]|uniref:Glutathione S-transferase n=1 Tax=Ziziphus jujuba TaxID=326968 RepID=A0ABM3IK92_ZIZJJ|nr:glutathione S-transferase U9-like [Ziziphus jujuba]
MAEENRVILHGVQSSPFFKRVELGLRAKGIPFEYVEEDLQNKSQLLLKYNPVHKKIPVLVHNGKPICESLVILEYIDETWRDYGPKLLPQDPYKRAQIRFWISFFHQQLFETMYLVIISEGDTQEKATKELYEKFEVFEQGMKEFFPDGTPSVDSNKFGILDILLVTTFGPHEVQSEVLGIKVIDPVRTPLIFSWISALNKLPLVKELIPPYDKLVAALHTLRNVALKSTAA